MKTLVHYISAALIFIIVNACNNDFLSKGPDLSSLSTTSEILISPDWETKEYTIHVSMAGNADFIITKTPDWLHVETISGKFTNDITTIRCKATVKNEFSETGIYQSSMVLEIAGSGKIIIPVSYIKEGTPSLQCSDNQLDFNQTDNTLSLNISNQGHGLLIWEIDSCPEWLTVSETGGILSSNSSKNVVFTCDRSLLSNEKISHTIFLRTNDKDNQSYKITVTVDNYIEERIIIQAIEGTVTDACMDKTAGILYLTTSQPNRMIAFNTVTKSIDKACDFGKTPTCFSLSENGREAIIGHEKMISRINLDNFSITKTIAMDYNIFDIEWGAGDWCSFTWEQVNYHNLHWLNLNTEEIYETYSIYGFLYGKIAAKKIPHQNFIVSSILSNTPSRIFVFDIQERNITRFFGDDIGSFWFSTDGKYLFSSRNKIYETASLSASSGAANLIGNFSPNPNSIQWIEHNANSHSVWILTNSSNNADDSQREIQQFDDNDFTYKTTYHYENDYKGYPAQAQYFFTNYTGNEMYIIKNNTLNDWSVEIIPINN